MLILVQLVFLIQVYVLGIRGELRARGFEIYQCYMQQISRNVIVDLMRAQGA